MSLNQRMPLFFVAILGATLATTAVSQDTSPDAKKADSLSSTAIPSGQKQIVKGVIIKREPDSFVLRDQNGAEINILLNNSTIAEERKTNPFRSATRYATTQLLRGLNVEVEGRRNNSGAIAAEKIRFRNDDYRIAQTVESTVTPVENRVGQAEGRLNQTETRLSQSEQNARRLSGQLEELSAVSNAARGGAKAAQETADVAVAGARSANERISSIDDYEARHNAAVLFRVNSSILTREAKDKLDDLATQAKNEKGFVLEVTGYASAEGNKDLNRRLSQQRADAVIQYLVEEANIPLRRIVTPFGYGVSQPVADNRTRHGRQQNRRVEVKILVSRGIAQPAVASRPSSGS
ncbi:MAG: OmpA family protein [Acidobacteria bacterium]|nr:OmpA family protein [Acidobacteriota bacterium]MBI3658326.1 OmpA family protein [Acidobacteriota bacterium]